MSIFKREQYIEKAFQKLFSAPARLSFELSQLIQLLKIEPKAQQILNKILDQSKSHKISIIFKLLILFNKLIMEFVLQPSVMFQIIERIEAYEQIEFDKALNQKLIKPYKLYLMKRCQFLPKKSSSIDKMYQLMNLIQAATGFSEIIYTLGRYYSKSYPFAVDFNIILGSDLNTVYNQMVKYTPKPPPCQILQQYQKIHQKMYIVYYNCYFYKSLKPFVPRWVITDILQPENKLDRFQSITTFGLNKSLEETFDSSSRKKSGLKKIQNRKISLKSPSEFNMTQSAVISIFDEKNKKIEQSIMLLKQMERVFEELEEF